METSGGRVQILPPGSRAAAVQQCSGGGGGRGEGSRCQEDRAEKPGVADATTNSLPKLIFCRSLSIIKLDMGRWGVVGERIYRAPGLPPSQCIADSTPTSRPDPFQQQPSCPGPTRANFPLVATLGRVGLFRRDLWRTPEDILSFPPALPTGPFVPLKAFCSVDSMSVLDRYTHIVRPCVSD